MQLTKKNSNYFLPFAISITSWAVLAYKRICLRLWLSSNLMWFSEEINSFCHTKEKVDFHSESHDLIADFKNVSPDPLTDAPAIGITYSDHDVQVDFESQVKIKSSVVCDKC